MLGHGLFPDIERYLQMTPFTVRRDCFLATCPEINVSQTPSCPLPRYRSRASRRTTSENIKQGVLNVQTSRKDANATEKRKVRDAVDRREGEQMHQTPFIFCKPQEDVMTVAKSLKKITALLTPRTKIHASGPKPAGQDPRRVPAMAICASLVAS